MCYVRLTLTVSSYNRKTSHYFYHTLSEKKHSVSKTENTKDSKYYQPQIRKDKHRIWQLQLWNGCYEWFPNIHTLQTSIQNEVLDKIWGLKKYELFFNILTFVLIHSRLNYVVLRNISKFIKGFAIFFTGGISV